MSATFRSSLPTLLLSALGTGATAATICVSPAGGACQTSLQDAVNLAGPGDTIRITAGTHPGNVTVPTGKDGLQIVGASRLTTTIDAYQFGGGGYGIQVYSNNVQIRNLGFRNDSGGAIVLNGNVALVSGNRMVSGNTGVAAASGTNGHKILANEVRSMGGHGIYVASGNTIVQGNTISQAYTGIGVGNAMGAQVLTNRITGCAFGLTVQGATAPNITGNLIETSRNGSFTMDVEASLPVVRGNKLTNAQARVRCTTCAGALVEANSLKGSPGVGFHLFAADPGLVVRSNTVTGAAHSAFLIMGTSIAATLNTATDSGSYSTNYGCFQVQGTGHSLTSNKATRCRRTGFYVQADSTTLVGNTSTEATTYGFTVDGSGGTKANNNLTSNRADASNAGGYAVVGGAINTFLAANTGTRNRYDFCDDGTGTDTSAGNGFASTSTVCDLVP